MPITPAHEVVRRTMKGALRDAFLAGFAYIHPCDCPVCVDHRRPIAEKYAERVVDEPLKEVMLYADESDA